MAENTSSAPFPDILAPKEEKVTKEYGLAYARAIWNERILNQDTFNETRRIFLKNREYAEGMQSIQNMKDRKGVTDTSYLNLDFRPVNIIAPTIDNAVGKLMRLDFKATCTPLDSESKNERDDYRNKLRAARFLKGFSDQIEPLTGMPLVEKGMKIPETDEEEEIFMQMNFKYASSVAMEAAFRFVHSSNMFPAVKEKVLRDLLENKIAVIATYYDEDYNIKYERVDFLDLIIPFSNKDDFSDITQFGRIRYYTIGDIANMGNFTDEELHHIAKLNAGRNNNTKDWMWGNTYDSTYFKSNIVPGYYSFKITVMDFEFLGLDKEVREFKTVKRRKYLNNIPLYDVANATGEIISKQVQNRYEGTWIVGTDYLVKYEKTKNMPRERVQGSYSPKTTLSINIISPNIFNMKNKSHVERMIPHEDQINLAHLGFQTFLIKAKPPGVAVDIQGLLDAAKGLGETMKPLDVLKIYEATGNLVYSSIGEDGTVINSKVITELRGGVGDAIKGFMEVYQFERQLINEVIGYNSAVDASSPDSNALVGVQEHAIEATNNSLSPIFNALLRLINNANKRTALMIQDCIEHNNEAFITAIGQHSTEVLEIGMKLAYVQMGIDIELIPNDEDKALINQQIQLGQMAVPPLLTPSDVIRINQVMKESVKLAAQLLVYLEEKNRKARMQESQALQKQNGDIQMQSAQAATQGAIQTDAELTKNKGSLIQMEGQIKSKLSAQEFEQQKQLLVLQGQISNAAVMANNQTKVVVQDMANESKMKEQKAAHEHEESISEKEHEQAIQQTAFDALVTPKKEPAKK